MKIKLQGKQCIGEASPGLTTYMMSLKYSKRSREYNIPSCMSFVDYALDSIHHRAVFEALIAHRVQQKYINSIKETYIEGTAQVRTESSVERLRS